jgi:hypothetical protein
MQQFNVGLYPFIDTIQFGESPIRTCVVNCQKLSYHFFLLQILAYFLQNLLWFRLCSGFAHIHKFVSFPHVLNFALHQEMANRSTARLKRMHMCLRLAIFAAVSGMSSAESFDTCAGATSKFDSFVRCNRNWMHARRMMCAER